MVEINNRTMQGAAGREPSGKVAGRHHQQQVWLFNIATRRRGRYVGEIVNAIA